ncbi:MAG: anti-sigma factor antagonist [Chitinivibrionales bacterium]|nr:anti-sigma factor antagonist [Chitinivibrionales bacterium]MBD3358180.1 anti-sigma factor antagonist [Chitinivibrionales bacterium]
MKISTTNYGNVWALRVDRSILQENVPVLRERLSALIGEGKIRIVVDLSGASYLSSLGVAVIVDAKNRIAEAGGNLRLACVNQLIYNLLDITNLTKQLEIFDTVDEAVQSFET